MKLNRQHILSQFTHTMSKFMDNFNDSETINIADYSPDNTMLVMIDMINGFCNIGPLHSDFVNTMIPKISDFLDKTIKAKIPIVSYRDSHQTNAQEFKNYPPHCISGTFESALVTALERPELIDVPKNSTNGFLTKNPLELVQGDNIKHIFIIGCVTDICISDFALTMNKYLEEINQETTVYVIENLVDTFHIEDIHDRQLEHTLALYKLQSSGITLVRSL